MKNFRLKMWHATAIFIIGLFIIPIGLIQVYNHIPFTLLQGKEDQAGPLNFLFASLLIFAYFAYIGYSIIILSDKEIRPSFIEGSKKAQSSYSYNEGDEEKTKETGKNLKNRLKWIAFFLFGLYVANVIYDTTKTVYLGGKNVYNTSKVYHYQYEQKVQSKRGFYDKLWKTYVQKEEIAGLNKETFIEVTKIIMENRADGKNLTWKWVSENQHVPYEKFSDFYADLSTFIEQQREEYYGIEIQCQQIAQANNTLLDTFPNNFYNRFLECEKIDFQYGFLSDKTDSVFDSKKENQPLLK